MRRDYYAVLGIMATAAPREIRQAYRRLARQYSPDVNFWDSTALTLFEEIAEAYRVLSDPNARAMYDRFGPAVGVEAPAGRRGDDVHVTVELEFADVARGARLSLSVPRFSPCPACQGSGVRRAMEPVAVDIPAGVDSGTQVRVTGEGSAGPFGGARGDLIVSTRALEHPFFVRQGDGVHCEVELGVWEALRGARIRVPTPLGEAVLVVPPGTAPGLVFRLRGQGLPRLADGSVGDLYVTVRVTDPTGLDARTDELVRELERLLPGPSRAELARYRGGAS